MPATPPPTFGTHVPNGEQANADAQASADGQTFQIRYDTLVIAVGAYSQSPPSPLEGAPYRPTLIA